MKISELIIIYLACGAPLGVYFFLQHRRKKEFRTIVLKSFLTVIVWIPYAVRLLHSHLTKKLINKDFEEFAAADARRRQELEKIQNDIWQFAFKEKVQISIFEFREIFERYSGLTLAAQENEAGMYETEIFSVANHPNKNLAAKCLQRRNRSRLEFHQTLASKDFLKLLSRLVTKNSEKLRISALEFVRILNDAETLRAVEKLFAGSVQTESRIAVKETEKEVWNTNRHKPLPAQPISANLTSAMTQKTLLSKQD